ncbi:MAG: bifunctional oligoribonuclease/PAP phosphatase NrnA, partial [Mogibacterium sp.]|nr:bifunctional oligoribonuclease/PAP phosphatase NrnA [Mogibacterium sp.]
MLFKELKNGFTKVSFRSKNTDVAKISEKFDGGGHTNAAGCTIKKPMNIAVEKILDELREL